MGDFLSVFRKKATFAEFKISLKGYFDGWKFIESEEYKALNKIKNFRG